jgi:F420-dependent oxidoreductase-like protein
MSFGAQFWPQSTDWPALRDAAVATEAAGWDSVWLWDHLLAIQGPWHQPIFEGWTSLAAIASLTSRVRLGLMVGANTFRNPGLTAKTATTLDHVSGGRAILGIGGAWFEREHEAFGLEFGATTGERLDWLDESVGLLRRLLDGELVSHDGPHYRMVEALCAPRPVQDHLPILIGGSGPKKTLRTVARHADAWNTFGPPEVVGRQLEILGEHCSSVGRDITAIERTISFPLVIRDTAAQAEAVRAAQLAHYQMSEQANVPLLLGPPEFVADAIRPYVPLGVSTVIARLAAPYDHETIDRLHEVRALLDD